MSSLRRCFAELRTSLSTRDRIQELILSKQSLLGPQQEGSNSTELVWKSKSEKILESLTAHMMHYSISAIDCNAMGNNPKIRIACLIDFRF